MSQKERVKHYISVLGTGFYSECKYNYKGNGILTEYVQEAVIKLSWEEIKPMDRITIFVTKDAENKNWKDGFRKKDRNSEEMVEHIGLESILKREFPNNIIEKISIPEGKNQEECDTIFQKFYECVSEREELYFDITHGLRNLPMLILTIIEYAKVVKNISLGGIYYGAYELGTDIKIENKQIKEVEIFEQSNYINILDWSNAANTFIRYGNSEPIYDLFDKHYSVRRRDRDERARYDEMSKITQALKFLTDCINTGRGRGKITNPEDKNARMQKSIGEAYNNYIEKRKKLPLEKEGNYWLLSNLLTQIDNKVSCFENNDNLSIGLQTATWSLDNNMIQQGFTALDETVKTYVCKLLGVPDDIKELREDLAQNMVKKFGKDLENKKIEMKEGDENKEEIRIRFFESWCNEKKLRLTETEVLSFIVNDKDELRCLFQNEDITERIKKWFIEIPMEFIWMSERITINRNDINHFGFSKNINSFETLKEHLRKNIETFKDIVDDEIL